MPSFVDMSGLRNFVRKLRAGTAGPTPGPVNDMFTKWGVRYLAFLRTRYRRASRGDGTWPGLAESTKRQRNGPRKGFKGKRSFAILVDTGSLFAALTIGAPGNLFKRIAGGIRIGFSGNRHPEAKGMTFARLANIHQVGNSRLPKREILVPPDPQTLQGMRADAQRAFALLGKQSESKR